MFLVSVEFTHEMCCVPRPPEILRTDSANSRQYNGSTLGSGEVAILRLRPRIPFRFLADYHVKRKKNAIRLKHTLRNSCMEEYSYNDSFPTWKQQAERLERNGGPYGSCFQKWDRYN
jgi:hypothetical protein